jgi:hypothetical protein
MIEADLPKNLIFRSRAGLRQLFQEEITFLRYRLLNTTDHIGIKNSNRPSR